MFSFEIYQYVFGKLEVRLEYYEWDGFYLSMIIVLFSRVFHDFFVFLIEGYFTGTFFFFLM